MVDAKLLSREDNKAQIQITVPADRVDSALKSMYARIASSQKIDGFRKGKVPRHVLNSMFGLEGIHAQVLQDLLPDVYTDAIEELNIIPTDSPEFEPWPTIEEGSDMVVTAIVEVLPEFQIGDYSRFDLDLEEKVEAGPGEIDETILNMRKKRSSYEEAADRPARDNDRVTLDYKLTIIDIAGKEPETVFDENKNVTIHLGDSEILPDIEKKIVGMNIGEDANFVVKYPDNYQNEELSGKSVKVEVKLIRIEERKLPEIDTEFLKQIGRYDDEAALKKGVERNLIAYKMRIRDESLRNRVMSMILDSTHLEMPDKLVDEEVDTRMQKLRDMLAQNPDGPDFETILESKGLTEDKLREDEYNIARANLKKRIIFDEIYRREKLEITTEELTMALAQYAAQNGMNKSQIKKIAKNREFMNEVRTELKDRKITDFLATRARFKEQWENQAGEQTVEPAAEVAAESQEPQTAKEGEETE